MCLTVKKSPDFERKYIDKYLHHSHLKIGQQYFSLIILCQPKFECEKFLYLVWLSFFSLERMNLERGHFSKKKKYGEIIGLFHFATRHFFPRPAQENNWFLPGVEIHHLSDDFFWRIALK